MPVISRKSLDAPDEQPPLGQEAGDVVVIDPGHDAWTVGSEACVLVDFGESIDGSRLG